MRVKDLTSKWLILVSIFTFSLFCLCRRYQLSTLYEKYTNAANGGTLYNGDYWKEYRIGDLYHLWHKNNVYPERNRTQVHCKEGRCFAINSRYHEVFFPGSIADRYHKYNTAGSKKNSSAMYKAIVDYRNSTKQFEKHKCMLHLRIGDVINHSHENYTKINDDSFWEGIVSKLKSNNVHEVNIVAGMHKPLDETESYKFINKIRSLLIANGIKVNLHLGKSPDDDIIMAFNSEFVVSSGGGYGRLLKEFAQYNGAKII